MSMRTLLPRGIILCLFFFSLKTQVVLFRRVVLHRTRSAMSMPELAYEETPVLEKKQRSNLECTYHKDHTATYHQAGLSDAQQQCYRDNRSSNNATRRRSYSHAVRPRTPSPSPRARAPSPSSQTTAHARPSSPARSPTSAGRPRWAGAPSPSPRRSTASAIAPP